MCISDTHFPEKHSKERQQDKSTSTASYDNRPEIKHFILQEDEGDLQQNQGRLFFLA